MRLLLTLACVSLIISAQAQFEAFFNLYGGMGFHEGLGIRTHSGSQEDFVEVICGSIANGVGLSAGVRKPFNDHLQAGLNLEYFRGYRTLTDEFVYGGRAQEFSDIWHAQYNRIAVVPHIRTIFNPGNDRECYAQGGVVLPLVRRTNWTSESTTPAGTASTKGYSNDKFSLGYQYGLGMIWKRDNFAFELGVNGTQLVGKKNSFHYTSMINYQGEETIGELNSFNRETRYVNRIDPTSNNYNFNPNPDMDQPREELVPKLSNHNIGVTAGINLNF